MSDEDLRAMTQRFEEVVRENERLARRLADLEPAIGRFSLLVQMAQALRDWRATGSAEAEAEMYECLDMFDRREPALRRRKPGDDDSN